MARIKSSHGRKTQAFVNDDTADVSIPPGRQLFSYAGTQPLTLPAKFTQDGIIVRATVNGRGLDFVLDSGASGLFIDPVVARELGLTPYGRTADTIGGGDVEMGRVRIPEMSIGGLDMHDVVFTTSGFEEQASDDTRAVGLIGFDFLASGIFAIDFKRQTLQLYSRDDFDPKSLGLSGLPLQLDDGVPRADAWIEGIHGHFLVDTGAFQMLIYHDFAGKLPSTIAVTHRSEVETVGGAMETSIVNVQNLIFGGVKYEMAQAIEPNSSTFDILDYDGLIGRDVLQNYQSYFDYADGMLFVKADL
jgi:predicted aspartyl protease